MKSKRISISIITSNWMDNYISLSTNANIFVLKLGTQFKLGYQSMYSKDWLEDALSSYIYKLI